MLKTFNKKLAEWFGTSTDGLFRIAILVIIFLIGYFVIGLTNTLTVSCLYLLIAWANLKDELKRTNEEMAELEDLISIVDKEYKVIEKSKDQSVLNRLDALKNAIHKGNMRRKWTADMFAQAMKGKNG